jgi:PAS domain S-box-containing protein
MTADPPRLTDHHAFFALFEGVLQAAPDPTVVVDADGTVIFANAATERVLAWRSQELVGLNVDCLLPQRLRHGHGDRRRRYAAEPTIREMGVGLELVALRGDGSEVPVEVSLNPIPGSDAMRIVCVIRDIGPRRRVEQMLRELNASLEERVMERTLQLQGVNQELEMLTYSIAHDLRAPLRAIHAAATRLLGTDCFLASNEQRQSLQTVASRASQISSMLDDYLRLLGLGRCELLLQRIGMRPLIAEVCNQLRLGDVVDIAVGADVEVVADRGMMTDVWRQLIGNALKFSAQRAAPKIEITAHKDAEFAYFSVADNGVGFDPNHAQRLFRLFERLHAANAYPGNGVGLCLVKRIVERHNGGVTIEGALDQGARVTFWLPNTVRLGSGKTGRY